MLPSEAPMPPCAATVCERVGKTLLSTATFSPAWASCNEQRMPAPPAPTMTASKRRRAIPIGSHAPQDLRSPDRAEEQPQDRQQQQAQPQSGRAHVVHPYVAHADPRVVRSEEHTSELQSLRHLVCRL